VRPSPWRRRLCRASLAVAAAAGALVAAMWLTASAPVAWAAAALGLAVGGALPVREARAIVAWRIAADGRIGVQVGGAEADAAAEFVSSYLIVLRYGRRRLPIWRDAVPAAAFRRLSALARWRIERRQARVAGEETA
jgi:hypothetical protein